jgi:hypothetical protein
MSTVKILVAGDVQGDLDTLFQRVEAVNSKAGPFVCLLCIGEVNPKLCKPHFLSAWIFPSWSMHSDRLALVKRVYVSSMVSC